MMHTFKVLSATFAMLTLLSACDEKVDYPVISEVEIAYNNSKTATVGDDLHMKANILATNKIAKIVVTIHPEGKHAAATAQKSPTKLAQSIEWKHESVYSTKYEGAKNISFHEHIEVPVDAAVGHYHLHLMVFDAQGNSAEYEAEIELTQAVEK